MKKAIRLTKDEVILAVVEYIVKNNPQLTFGNASVEFHAYYKENGEADLEATFIAEE